MIGYAWVYPASFPIGPYSQKFKLRARGCIGNFLFLHSSHTTVKAWWSTLLVRWFQQPPAISGVEEGMRQQC